MNKRVRQLVVGFLNSRRNRAKLCAGIGRMPGRLTKAEIDAHTATGDAPAIYVGTYHKYNSGSLYGMWVDVASFDTYEDYIDFLHRLHSDEADPEFMAQDYENFPKQWYSESGIVDRDWFEKIKEYAELQQNEAIKAYIDYYGIDPDEFNMDDFEDAYEGEYSSEEDFAEYLVDEIGMENIQNKDYYFDYDKFARDLFITDYDFVDGYVFRTY